MDGILINLDDINLPTAGKAWKTMVAHVLYHIDHDELFSEINDDWIMEYIRDEEWSIQDIFDDDEVIDYINEAGIPPNVVFDEDYIVGCTFVQEKVAKQNEKIAELEKKVAELEKELAEFREWNAKMKDNGNEEWCRRCGSWQREGWNGIDRIVKDAKWGCVCEDCLHDLDNDDHEVCKACDCCKDCGCCECEGDETDELCEAIDASGNALY